MRLVRDVLRAPGACFGAVLVVLVIVGAALAPFLSPQDPYDLAQLDITDARLPPGSESSAGFTFLLGSDGQGRDMLSGILYGLRISLLVGLGSAAFAAVAGTVVGLLAGYAGGRTDDAVSRLVDLQLSFPSILVALIVLALLGRGVGNVMLALVLVEWSYYARTARAAALAERGRGYVEAAECIAVAPWRIVLRHLLPNCLPPLVVVLTSQVARAITLEATLSFLGVGVPITEPSLGLLVANGYQFVLSGQWWISLYPGLALLAVILGINLVGDRVRDLLNPHAVR